MLVLARRSLRARLSRIAATILGLAVAVGFTVAAFGVAAQFDRFVGAGTDQAAEATDAIPKGAVVIAAPAGGATQTTAVDESRRRRDAEGSLARGHAFAASHDRNSAIEWTVASGPRAARPSGGCAP